MVSSVDKATRTERKGSLTVAFDQITVAAAAIRSAATVTQALESEGIKGEVGEDRRGRGRRRDHRRHHRRRKGALLGVLIGGGGTIAATEGKDVELPAGTILRVRLDQPLR